MESYTQYSHQKLVTLLNERDAALLDIGKDAAQNKRLIHHLKLHQTELEIQNRQLQDTQAVLEVSREHYASMFDFSPAGILVLDKSGTIVEINLPALKLLKQDDRKFVTGMSVSKYLGVERQSTILNFLRHTGASGNAERFNFTFKDGDKVKNLCLHCLFDQEHGNYKCLLTDVTSLLPIEDKEQLLSMEVLKTQEAHRANSLLKCIDDLRSSFIKQPDPFKLYPELLDHLLTLTESKYGFIGEALEDADQKKFLKIYALSNISWDEDTNHLYETTKKQGFEFKNLDNLLGEAVKTGKPVFSNDPEHDLRSAGFPKGHPVLKAFLGIPVYFGDRLVGEIGLADKPGGYDEALMEELLPVIAALGQIIDARWVKNTKEKWEHDLQLKNEALSTTMQQLEKAVKENDELKKREKENIFRATVQSTQHILNNLLNQLSLVKMEIDRQPTFNKDVAAKFDAMKKQASILVTQLSSVQEIDEQKIKESVYPK
jgi:PAS domain-containing protein